MTSKNTMISFTDTKEEYFETSDGLKLHFTDTDKGGSGAVILCLAGLTRSSRDFDFVTPHLMDKHRLIKLDARGRGKSQYAEDFTSYNVQREALDVIELLDYLGLSKVAILGTSRGGIVSMVLATTAKERLIGVCLNDIGPVIQQEGLDRIKNYLGFPPTASTLQQFALERPKKMYEFENVPPSRWMEEAINLFDQIQTTENEIDDKSKGIHIYSLKLRYDKKLRDACIQGFDKCNNKPFWPLFEALDGLPLALIHGANSDLLSHETVLEMSTKHPDMILTHVQGRGHIPFLDEPESVIALQEWSKKLDTQIQIQTHTEN